MGKGTSSAGQSYNYFGVIAGLICRGPIDQVLAVIIDGKAVWEGTHTRPASYVAPDAAHPLNSAYTDLSTLMDAKWFPKLGNVRSGSLRVYWGTDLQTVPGPLTGHSDLKGWAYVMCDHILFGREKTTAPNIEVIVVRKPAAPTALVAAEDNTIEDGQVNPVAVLAELLTGDHGVGMAESRFDGPSWQEAATYARLDPGLRYCSALLGQAGDLRRACGELLALIDGVFAWTATGTLALRLTKPGVNPGGLPTLDAAILTGPPEIASGAWGDVPTAVVCRFHDRERKYKQADHKVDNLVAATMRDGETDTLAVDLPHVTRQNQAARWATEMVRRSHQPRVEITVRARPERVAGVGVGSKVLVDVDPEPGGSGIAQLAVVAERRDPSGKAVMLKLVADPISTGELYAPTYEVETPELVPVDPILHALVVPLPTTLGWGPAIAILATRPQKNAVGYDVEFVWDTDGDASIADETPIRLGRGGAFACRLTLTAALDAAGTSPEFALTDAGGGIDTYLADLLPESGLGAADNRTLIVLAEVDGDGRVAIEDGEPVLEFLSVATRTPVEGEADTHTYEVLRARLGLPARAWATSCEAWILPGSGLRAWTHPDMAALLRSGAVGTIRLGTVTAESSAETLLERSWVFPASYDLAPRVAWVQPAGSLGITDAEGDYEISFNLSDWDGDLVGFEVLLELDGGQLEVLEPRVPLKPTRGLPSPWTRIHRFPVGSHAVIVQAEDKLGNRTTSERSILRPSSGTIPPPVFTPAGADDLPLSPVTVQITGASPATKLEYSIAPIGVVAPAGAGTPYAGLTTSVTINPPRRLWARAGDALGNWSAWVSADYSSVSSGGGLGGGNGGLGIPGRVQQD